MHKIGKLYTIHNKLTPQYLSDTLHRYNTHTATNPVQLKYPKAKKESYESFFFLLYKTGKYYLIYQLSFPIMLQSETKEKQ